MDEETLQRRPAFNSVQKRLISAMTELTAIPIGLLSRRGGLPLAAE